MSEIQIFSTIGMRTVLEEIAKAFIVADLASPAHAALIRRKGMEPV